MGMFSKLFGQSGTKEQRQVARLQSKLINAHRQNADRVWAIQQLMGIGTIEAVHALLERFTYRTESSMHDEEEKTLVRDSLVELGEIAVEPLEGYVMHRTGIYWALGAYRRIRGEQATLDLICRALDAVDSGYTEEEKRKAELVSFLREFDNEEAFDRLAQVMTDKNDDVRVMAVEGLTAYPPHKALQPLVDRLLDRNETPRIRIVILEVLVDLGWSLKKYRASLVDSLPEAYELGPDGRLLRTV